MYKQLVIPGFSQHNTAMPETYYTAEELAEKWGKTREWIYSLIARGKLTAIKADDGTWRISEESIRNYKPSKGGRPRKRIRK